MTERTCENCRWWSDRLTGYGNCHKAPPIVSSDEAFPSTHKTSFCGEWSDKTITPEQEERRELTRQIAVQLSGLLTDGNAADVWRLAEDMANADPWRQT